MMRRTRTPACLLATALVLTGAGCGGDTGSGFGKSVDRARSAAAMAQLQTVLVTATPLQAEMQAATTEQVVAALQAKDGAHRYTTTSPADASTVQVAGGGTQPMMFVMLDPPQSSGGAPVYVAAWQGSGATAWYAGADPPAYAVSRPTQSGWSASPSS